MLKIRRPLGRLIFNMEIAIPGKTVFLIETAPRKVGLSYKRPENFCLIKEIESIIIVVMVRKNYVKHMKFCIQDWACCGLEPVHDWTFPWLLMTIPESLVSVGLVTDVLKSQNASSIDVSDPKLDKKNPDKVSSNHSHSNHGDLQWKYVFRYLLNTLKLHYDRPICIKEIIHICNVIVKYGLTCMIMRYNSSFCICHCWSQFTMRKYKFRKSHDSVYCIIK